MLWTPCHVTGTIYVGQGQLLRVLPASSPQMSAPSKKCPHPNRVLAQDLFWRSYIRWLSMWRSNLCHSSNQHWKTLSFGVSLWAPLPSLLRLCCGDIGANHIFLCNLASLLFPINSSFPNLMQKVGLRQHFKDNTLSAWYCIQNKL